MEPFRTHTGRMAVLDWSDVNTDLIIPARYLKRIERIGYGPLLFQVVHLCLTSLKTLADMTRISLSIGLNT